MRKLKLLIAVCALMAGSQSWAQTWTGNEPEEGTFFLYNVGAEKFINNGDPAEDWGTNAYLQSGFGLDFKLELSDGAYNLNTNISNGGSNNYFATSTWCDQSATPWTFTAVEGQTNTYTISNSDSYLAANEALNDVVCGASTGDNKSWWKLVSLDDFKAAMQAKTYSATDPMDVSVFIQGRSFARNDGRNSSWTTSHKDGNWVWIGASSDNKYYGNESWNNTFSVSQTIENLPDGTYELQCSGFGTNGTTYIFANSTSKAIQTDNTTTYGANKEAKWKAIHEDNAFAGQSTGTFTLSGGTLNLGIKRETNNGGDWAIWDEFRLYYYGLDLSEFAATLAAAVSAAEAVEGTVPTAAYNALAAVVTENDKTYTTAAEYTAAANAIESATTTAKELQTNYARYNSLKAAALAIATSLDTSTADSEVNAATTNEAIDAAIATLRASFLGELPNLTIPTDPGYIDVTSVMVDNASVSENTNYWTAEGTPNVSYSWGVCNYGECEFYQQNFKFYQTLALTPGTWEFGVTGFHRSGNHKTYFYAGEDKILIPGVESSVVNTMAAAKTYFDNGNGKVSLKFLVETNQNIEIGINNQDTETDKWTIFRNFTLKYYGEPDYSVYEDQWTEAVAAADAALTTYAEYDGFVATEKTALTTAKADAPTAAGLKAGYIEKISTLTEATSDYIAACQKYESAKEAIAKANAIKEAHNFATAEATETFTNAIKAVSDKYDDGTLTQEEAAAAGTTLGTAATGNRANPNGAAVNYLESGFGLTDYQDALYINTWSVEGDNDGSGFSVPFYEYWDSDASSLAKKTWTGTLTNLPNGQYKVSAWVRVRAKDETAATDATGITVDVNGGDPVDVTEGARIGTSQFTIASYEATGLVKDGKLIFNVNVAADNNISWLSFKNVTYTKVRDLTAEEAAVVPANLAITATTTVFKGKTVTLTPTSTTEDASIDGYVTWTSDDTAIATVDANGVVTGVAYGTANITATSTLNAEATATCAVTVTAPTYDQLENLDFAEGPVATTNVVTYDKDKGTGKAQMQEVTGWTIANNGDARAAAVMAYNSGLGLGSASGNAVPTEGPDGSNSNALGVEAVWKADVQYTQDVLFTPGIYTIIAYVYNQAGDGGMSENLIGFIEDGGTKHFATTTNYTVGEWTKDVISFTLTENTYGKLSVGYNASQSGNGIGNGSSPHLWIDRLDIESIPTADADDYSALNAAIDAKDGKTLGFQKDEYAPYNNVAVLTALNAAKAIEQTILNTKSTVTAATAALNDAEWAANTEEVNAIYDGTFAAAENNGAPAGWTMSNNTIGGDYHSRVMHDTRLSEFNNTNSALFIRFDGTNSDRGSMYYYGNTAGYTMPLKAGTIYRATVDIKGWGYTGKNQRMNISGPEGFTTVSQNLTLSDNADTDNNAPQQFNIVFTATVDGNYVINFQTPGGDDQKHNAVISNLKLFTEPESSATLAVSNAKYGTFIAPFAVEIPEDVTAYTVSTVDGNTLTMEEVSTSIAANTPVVLYSESAVSKEVKGYSLAIQDAYTSGLLTGVYTETAAPAGSYVLQNKDSKVGFYKVAEGEQPTVGANRCYLTAPTQSRALYFPKHDATGINALNALVDGDAQIFNAAGARIPKLQKGMNIIKTRNGGTQKVMVK